MKKQYLMLAAAMGLAVSLSSCENDEVMPDAVVVQPGSGNDSGTTTPPSDLGNNTPPASPTDPGTNTPPPVNTPPVNNTPPSGTGDLLTRMGARQFTYDAQKRLVEVIYPQNPTQGYTVIYEGDKPVRLNYKNGNYLAYTYSGDKIVKAESFYGENLVNYRYTFEYSGDKLVKQTTMSFARTDQGQLGVTEFKYDANGNLTQITTAWSTSNRVEGLGSASIILYGNYDSKTNPESFYVNSSVYLPGIKLFENNPGYREPSTGKEIYTYVYNANGFPTQRSTKLEAYPNAQAFLDGYEYR